MLDITILTIGKIKEKYWQEAIDEYLKRLKPYAKIKMEELKHKPFKEGEEKKAREEEGVKILNYLEKIKEKINKDNIFILDEGGDNMTSRNFSKLLDEKDATQIYFIIGGTAGFGCNVLNKNYKKISLSKMTFPHELARVVILEQIFRAITISKGKKYHY